MSRHPRPHHRALRTLCLPLLLAGCSHFKPVPINPPPLNPHAEVKVPPRVPAPASLNPAQLAHERYLQALAAAAGPETPDRAVLERYADAGIALVRVQCRRWFGLLSDRQLTKDFEDSNVNVIRQLGTALLGVGGANPVIVTSYGAFNTAYEGVSSNVESSFLVAPNGRKVKEKVSQLLDSAAPTVLDGLDKGLSFVTVYQRLENFGDICTHATARELINTALDQADAKLGGSGRLLIAPREHAKEIATLTADADHQATEEAKAKKELADIKVRSTTMKEKLEALERTVDLMRPKAEPPAAPASSPASAPGG